MIEVQKSSNYTRDELIQLMRNAFNCSWLDVDQKNIYIEELELYASKHT